MKKILLIHSAAYPQGHLNNDYQVRRSDYLSSFYHALRHKDKFDNIWIVETFSKSPVDFLDNCGIPVFYSPFANNRSLSMNELLHTKEFVDQDWIDDDDIIIKITGRYILCDTRILDYFKDGIDFVAKDSDDLWKWASHVNDEYGNGGVHTFLYGFRKKFFKEIVDFANFINKPGQRDKLQIEHFVKRITWNRPNCIILDKNEKIGVITCMFNHRNDIGTTNYYVGSNFLRVFV